MVKTTKNTEMQRLEIALDGFFDHFNVKELAQALENAKDFSAVIIDLSSLEAAGSALADALITFWKKYPSDAKKVTLQNPSPIVDDTIRITQMDHLFKVNRKKTFSASFC